MIAIGQSNYSGILVLLQGYVYFLFPFVSAPYRDCVELLNAGISKTDIHIIRDKNWILPVYCDQDYMGGGRMAFTMTDVSQYQSYRYHLYWVPCCIDAKVIDTIYTGYLVVWIPK